MKQPGANVLVYTFDGGQSVSNMDSTMTALATSWVITEFQFAYLRVLSRPPDEFGTFH